MAAGTGVVAGLVLLGDTQPKGLLTPAGLAMLALFTVTAALAAGTHPARRHEAGVLVLQGARRYLVRLMVLVAVAVATVGPGLVAVLAGLAFGVGNGDSRGTAVAALLFLPALGAIVTGGARLPPPVAVGQPHLRMLARTGFAAASIGLGIAMAATVSTGSGLELVLPVSLFLAFVGLFALAPLAADVIGWAAGHGAGLRLRLAGTEVRQVRRALTVPVAVTAGIACLLVVQTMLGAGLAQRENARRTAIHALSPASAGLSGRQLVVGYRGERFLDFGDTNAVSGPELIAITGRVAPLATVSLMQRLPLTPRSARAVYGDITREGGSAAAGSVVPVAVATPQLLAALGLDPALARSERATVLDPRALRNDGTVRVAEVPVGPEDDRIDRPTRDFPAHLARTSRLPVGLPAVLVPAALVPDLKVDETNAAVISFPGRPTDRQVETLRKALRADVVRGDQPVDVAAHNRTDDIGVVGLRTSAEVTRFAVVLGAIAVFALLVAQVALALAHRRDDEVLHLLGARPASLAMIAAARGALIGAAGTIIGATVGVVGTLVGLGAYAANGRFGGPDPLLRVPVALPLVTIAALVALPVLSGGIGAAVSRGRPTADAVTRAERLAW